MFILGRELIEYFVFNRKVDLWENWVKDSCNYYKNFVWLMIYEVCGLIGLGMFYFEIIS